VTTSEALDIRVGTIRKVEDVPGSEKLLRLIVLGDLRGGHCHRGRPGVDFGNHERTILSGMKGEHSNPREIEGRQALFLVNLPPRKMAGEVSEGMSLDLGFADGIAPAVAVPEQPVPDGTRAG